MIYVIGISIAFFLALLIFTKKGRNLADTILGAWMVIIGVHLFVYYSYVSGLVYEHPQILRMNLPYSFLHGPMLYLYTQALTNPEKFQSKKWLFHFVLPIFILLLRLPLLFVPENEVVKLIKGHQSYQKDWQSTVSTALLFASGFFYVYINNQLLLKHKKRILSQFSNQDKINLDWLRVLFYGMGMMWFFIIFIAYDPLIFSAAAVFTTFIGYYGIKQVGVFTNHFPQFEEIEEPVFENTLEENSPEKKKYAKSGLNEDMATEIHLKLANLMQTERLFTEPELTLNDLATRLDIHPNYLSQVINKIEGVNFYDYINTLRIEEFKRLVAIPDNQRFTLLALAYDCGFNSKSAFNRFFKKVTNMPPSAYVKNSLK